MPYQRPTLAEIIERIKTDISSRLTGGASVLRRAVIAVLATVYGGAVHLLYGFIDWVSRQIIPTTAEDEFLLRWASFFGIEKIPASFARRDIEFTGTDGSVIPDETVMQRADGTEYQTDGAGTIVSGTVTVSVVCLVAGTAGNIDEGAELQLIAPIAGVNSTGTVQSSGKIDAVDEETNESVLARLLLDVQEPAHGGNTRDYVQWAREVAGVTRVWVYPLMLGPSTVGVSFVRDNDTVSIIPDPAEVAEVQDYIDNLAPVTAEVTVFAPNPVTQNFNITLTPDTAEVRAAVIAELTDLLSREAEPGGTLLLSHINEAISTATGETDHVLNSPTADVVSASGDLLIMGTVTW